MIKKQITKEKYVTIDLVIIRVYLHQVYKKISDLEAYEFF